MVYEALKIVLPALLSAALSGIWVSRWKANLDHAEKRIDDLCAEISKLSDLASDYWTTEQTSEKIVVLQARISAGFIRLASIRVAMSSFVSGLDEDRLVESERQFWRESTGDDFGVHNRLVSHLKAAAVQYAGTAYAAEVRKARMNALKRWWLPHV